MAKNPPSSNEPASRSSPNVPAVVTLPRGASADSRRDAIVAVIRATGLTPRQAAMSVGVSSSAYYRLAEDPAFVAAIEAATATFARRMSAVIAKAAGSLGSWRAAAFWLERRMPESYGQKVDLTVEQPDPEDRYVDLGEGKLGEILLGHFAEVIDRMTDDERATFLEDLRDPNARSRWATRGRELTRETSP